MKPIYAQLYSVKDAMENAYMQTLREIALMGYTGVEFAGYGEFSAKELRKSLEALNITCLSAHVPLEKMEANPKGELEFLRELGSEFIVCPYYDLKTMEDVKVLAEKLNIIGEVAKSYKMKVLYHNHAHEFVKDGDAYLLDRLFDEVDAGNLYQQPDLYWIAYAGLDPLAYLEKIKDRSPIVHLKQMENMETKKNVTADAGFIDFKKATEIAANSAFIYEQETMEMDPLEAMKRSVDYLKEV
jgi:sugar phosphate isomerase/epimerase